MCDQSNTKSILVPGVTWPAQAVVFVGGTRGVPEAWAALDRWITSDGDFRTLAKRVADAVVDREKSEAKRPERIGRARVAFAPEVGGTTAIGSDGVEITVRVTDLLP